MHAPNDNALIDWVEGVRLGVLAYDDLYSDPMGHWVRRGPPPNEECPKCGGDDGWEDHEPTGVCVKEARGKSKEGVPGIWFTYKCSECGHRWREHDPDY